MAACVSRASSSRRASTAKWNGLSPVPSNASCEWSLAEKPSRFSRKVVLESSSLGGPATTADLTIWGSVAFTSRSVAPPSVYVCYRWYRPRFIGAIDDTTLDHTARRSAQVARAGRDRGGAVHGGARHRDRERRAPLDQD